MTEDGNWLAAAACCLALVVGTLAILGLALAVNLFALCETRRQHRDRGRVEERAI